MNKFNLTITYVTGSKSESFIFFYNSRRKAINCFNLFTRGSRTKNIVKAQLYDVTEYNKKILIQEN